MPDPIGNWGLVNDICRLVRAPQNIEEVLPVHCLMCRVFYYVRRSVLFKIHAANIEA